MPRHRHQEYLKFLRKINRDTPQGLDLHLIVDNYGTHKHPNVKSWLAKHPRCHLHFTDKTTDRNQRCILSEPIGESKARAGTF